LDQPTLTAGLGADRSPEELRASLPNPWTVIATIVGVTLAMVVGINGLVWGIRWLIQK
jgi:hypothetical protein